MAATESSLRSARPLDSVAPGLDRVPLLAVPFSLQFWVHHPIGDIADIFHPGRAFAGFANEQRGYGTAREGGCEADILGIVIVRAVVLRVLEIAFLGGVKVDARGVVNEFGGIDGIEGLGELDRGIKAVVLGNGNGGVSRHAESEGGMGEKEEDHGGDNEEMHRD